MKLFGPACRCSYSLYGVAAVSLLAGLFLFQVSMKCQLCQAKFSSYRGVSNHLKAHSITSEAYYRQFLATSVHEGICAQCGMATRYAGMGLGYTKYCSTACYQRSPEGKAASKQAMSGNTHTKGHSRTDAFKQNLSDHWKGHPGYWRGKKKGSYPPEWCANIAEALRNSPKLRDSQIQRAREQCESHGLSFPTLGKNEAAFFDALQKKLPYPIEYQAQKCGYLVDGYIPSLNIAIELDEAYHQELDQPAKDLKRQRAIESALGCKFIRVLEVDWIASPVSTIEAVINSVKQFT